MHPDPVYPGVCALALAVILTSAAVHKLRTPARFARQLDDYALLPQALLAPLTRAIPLLEAALALGLVLPAWRNVAALGAAALLALYALAMALSLWRGRGGIDCGCSGPGQMQPLRPALLLRNAGLIALALIAAQAPLPRPFGVLDWGLVLFAGSTLVLLYTAIDTLLANAPRLGALNGK